MIRVAGLSDVKRIKDADNEGTLNMTAAEKSRQGAQDWYARIVGNTLVKEYPGIQWKVTIVLSKNGGLAYIQVPRISGKFGMSVHLKGVSLNLEQEVKLAGGELLERFNVSRLESAAENDLNSLPRDITGEAIGASKGEVSK